MENAEFKQNEETLHGSLPKDIPTVSTEIDELHKGSTLGFRVSETEYGSMCLTSRIHRSTIQLPNISIFQLMVAKAISGEKQTAQFDSFAKERNRSKLDALVVDYRRNWVRVWDLVRDMLLLYSLISTMYFLAFAPPALEVFVVDIIVWAFFLADLGLRFLIMYEDEENRVVTSFRRIGDRYLKGWFALDLLAVIPMQFWGKPDIEYYFRLVRVFKVKGALDLLDGTGLGMLMLMIGGRRGEKHSLLMDLTMKSMASITAMLVLMLFYTYSMACIWFWYSKQVEHLQSSSSTAHTTFGDYFPSANACEQLQRSWYFMITTLVTVGFGDLLPTNSYERLLLILILFTGVTAYSYIIGQFNSLVAELDNIEEDRFSKFTLWIERLETLHLKLSPSLKSKLLSDFAYFNTADRLKNMALRWWEAGSVEEMTIPTDPFLSQIPEKTLRELQIYLFSDVFSRFKAFFGPENFKYDVSFHLHPRRFCVGEFVVEQGEDVQEIVLVMKGEVGLGPIVAGEFMCALTFNNRAIVGDYSAIVEEPSYTNFKTIGSEPLVSFAIPVKPFLVILNEKYPSYVKDLLVFSRRKALFALKAIAHLERQMKEGEESGSASVRSPFRAPTSISSSPNRSRKNTVPPKRPKSLVRSITGFRNART